MKIRKFRLAELPRIMEIERASFGPDSYGPATFMAHVFRDRKGFFVAEGESCEILGYVLVRLGLGWLGARRGGITSIAVAQDHRRRGIGRGLLSQALGYLREKRVGEVDLEVSLTNEAAKGMYEQFGFRRSRVLPHYYGANRHGVRMVLDLTGEAAEAGSTRGATGEAEAGEMRGLEHGCQE